jgi:hypothetical protein
MPTTTKVPTMTRQHFAFIASVIASLPSNQLSKGDMIALFANELGATNARFDRERFIQACLDS